MACRNSRSSITTTNPQRAATERTQRDDFARIYETLHANKTITVAEEQLNALHIVRGQPIDVDNWANWRSDPSPCFFSPCDWSQESLEWESWSEDSDWKNLERLVENFTAPLDVARWRSAWFHVHLLNLESIEENVWENVAPPNYSLWQPTYEAIVHRTGLHLPRHQYPYDEDSWDGEQFDGNWVYFAASSADKPHAVCTMIDSARPDDAFPVLRSEAEAAVKMTQHQLQKACYTHHYTKPILVCTFFRNETARVTQAHIHCGKLILRQSRLLDLSGLEPGPDAWTLLRWMASGPVGRTEYPAPGSLPAFRINDGASRPPQVTLSGH